MMNQFSGLTKTALIGGEHDVGHRKKIIFVIQLLALLIFGGDVAKAENSGAMPIAKNGVIDLRNWSFDHDGAVRLNGDWNFYWRDLKYSDEFGTDTRDAAAQTFAVPSMWNGRNIEKTALTGFGFATYHLRIQMPKEPMQLHFIIPELNMAYKLWADGLLISGSGKIGTTINTEIPRSQIKIAKLGSYGDILEIVLQISNHYHLEGGIGRAIEIDLSERIAPAFQIRRLIDVFTIGALMVLGFYYFVVYLGRRQEVGHLLYGILALLFMLRVLAVTKLPYLVISHDHIWSTRAAYVTMFLLMPVYVAFVRWLFPNEFSKWINRGLLIIGVVGATVTMFTPAHIFSLGRDPYGFVIQFALVYTLGAVIWATVCRRDDAALALGFILIFVATGINDTLHYQRIISTTDLSQFGFLVFMIGHAAILGRRMTRAFNNEEKASRNLAKLNRSLETQVEERTSELQSANRAKDVFLATASHDLRQPLHAMGLFVAQLKEQKDINTSDSAVDKLQSALMSMNDLFGSILDVSRINAGAEKPNLQNISIAPIINQLVAEMMPYAEEKGLDLRAVSCGATIISDQILLYRILQNFLTNAIRYTDQGKILFGCRHMADRVRIEVWDTGRGISKDELSKVMHEFYQVRSDADQARKGIGLGLSIARGLTDLIGGDLKITSVEGRGSCFAIEIPLGNSNNIAEPKPALEGSHPNASGCMILVIDNDALVLSGMLQLLSGWGYQVKAAASKVEAVSHISDNWQPEIVIADYHLAGRETGLDAIAVIRERCGIDISCIIITGDTSAEVAERTSGKVFATLIKPLRPGRLATTLRQVVTGHALKKN